MADQVFPTKGNLISTKKSLDLAKVGFELLDRKRNIIVREMMALIDRAETIQSSIDSCYADAYLALQQANSAGPSGSGAGGAVLRLYVYQFPGGRGLYPI